MLIEPARREPHDNALLVFGHGCSYRQLAEDWARAEMKGEPPEIMEFGSLDAIVGCVAAGLGRSLVPEAAARASVYAPEIRITPLGTPYESVPTFFIRRHDTAETRTMSELLTLMRKMTAEQAPSPRRKARRSPAA